LIAAHAAAIAARTPEEEAAAEEAAAASTALEEVLELRHNAATEVLNQRLTALMVACAVETTVRGDIAKACAGMCAAQPTPASAEWESAVDGLLAQWLGLSGFADVPRPNRSALDSLAAAADTRMRAAGAAEELLAVLHSTATPSVSDVRVALALLADARGTAALACGRDASCDAVVAAMHTHRGDEPIRGLGCCALATLSRHGVVSGAHAALCAARAALKACGKRDTYVRQQSEAAIACLAASAAAAAEVAAAALLAEEEAEHTARAAPSRKSRRKRGGAGGQGGAGGAGGADAVPEPADAPAAPEAPSPGDAGTRAEQACHAGGARSGGDVAADGGASGVSDAAQCSGSAAEAPHTVTSDEVLAQLFPWMALHAAPAAPPAAAALALPPSHEDEAHEDDGLCVCCLDAERDTPLAGCADAHPPVMCAACAVLLCARAAPACPLCRAPVVAA
jgi:hypothetical protein